MFILGLTGPSGAGKNEAAKILEKYGFFHIDTDIIAHEILPIATNDLIRVFGNEINENNIINRKKLAEIAFKSQKNIQKLNKIMHSYIMKAVKLKIDELKKNEIKKIVLNGAALFEASADKICDKILVVNADKKLRTERVMARDKISVENAELRFSRQKSDEFFEKNSDYMIINDEKDVLEQKILVFVNKIDFGE